MLAILLASLCIVILTRPVLLFRFSVCVYVNCKVPLSFVKQRLITDDDDDDDDDDNDDIIYR